MSDKMQVSSNPHIRSKMTTQAIMGAVFVALLPTTLMGIVNFGPKAACLVVVSVLSAVLTEYIAEKILHRENTIKDLSAAVTGLLLALNLPPAAPVWIAVVGSVFAILVVKVVFGGLGQNFMNPALGGRCFLLISFAGIMTNFDIDYGRYAAAADAVSASTPLNLVKTAGPDAVNVMDMILGFTKGTIGETSMIAIVIGACLLLLLGIIDLIIPASYIISFAVFVIIFGGYGLNPVYLSAQLAGGGLMLGAFFMATDYVTRPITKKGQIVFGIFCGVMTGIFRIFGPGAEGVSYAIIIGNLLVPLIEKFTLPKAFGKGGENA